MAVDVANAPNSRDSIPADYDWSQHTPYDACDPSTWHGTVPLEICLEGFWEGINAVFETIGNAAGDFLNRLTVQGLLTGAAIGCAIGFYIQQGRRDKQKNDCFSGYQTKIETTKKEENPL